MLTAEDRAWWMGRLKKYLDKQKEGSSGHGVNKPHIPSVPRAPRIPRR